LDDNGDGSYTVLGLATKSMQSHRWYELSLGWTESTISFSVDGFEQIRVTNSCWPSGDVWIGSTDADVYLDDFQFLADRAAGSSTNIADIECVWIPPGSFPMGSTAGDADEQPVHTVQITRGFWMGKYEITQAQYSNVMGVNPATLKGPNYPVDVVSWINATNFCGRLSSQSGRRVRLPTEAEWEYACRAGTTTPYSYGSTISCGQVNYSGCSGQMENVGTHAPNAFGLYDMHGNVLEYCSDWYAANYYGISPEADPQGPGSGTERVQRGGSWSWFAQDCRSAERGMMVPDNPYQEYGFRVVVEP
jgi:formylglycine-generating enzyme required for sulfatase activity